MSSTSTDTDTRAPAKPVEQVGDRVFANLALAAGVLILVVLAGVAAFLLAEAVPAHRGARVGAAGGPQPHRLHRPARLRHHPLGGDRAAGGHPAGGGRGAVHHPLRATPDRPDAGLPRRPARRGAQHRLRVVGSGRARPGLGRAVDLAQRVVRLAAVLRRSRLRDRAHDARRRPRPRRHDPADHHRGVARGLPPDAQAARGGGAGPRRHALGDDPDGGAARSAAPASSAERCSAWVVRWARRWPWPSCCRCPARSRST